MTSWDFVDGGSPSEHHNPARHSQLSFESVESITSGPKVLRKIKIQDTRLVRSDSGTQKAEERKAKRDENQSLRTLNLEFEWEESGEEDLMGRGIGSMGEEGFEMQDTVGGHSEVRDRDGGKGVGERDSGIVGEGDAGNLRGLVNI